MISAAKKLARLLLASAAAAGFAAPAVSAPLSADPNVRQLSNRKNYEPGGKYFLFGNARGGVQKRNGKINIRTSPPVAAGNMETETVYFGGRYGYETKFGGHPWQAHGPFDETAARNGKGKGAGVADGFGATNYVYSISATKVHPANGYDGPQGGNFPPPKGARDIYSYSVSGSASRSRMVEPQKAPCVAGVSCPASPFFNHIPPGTETHSDRHIREGAQEQSQTARKNIEDAVRLARSEALRTEEIAKGITRVRDFEQEFHTDKPYGFTADQLAAFGRGEVSPLGWLVANGTGVEHSRIRPEYITPEYIGPTGGNTVPDWIRQPLKQDADVLAKTANALTRQSKSQLTEWDNGRSFPANAAQKVAGAASIIKTARDGLAETTVGKKIGAATDAVTPDALKNGIGKLVDAGNRRMGEWAGNDPDRKAYAAAAGGVIGIVADSRLPGKGRGKNRHKHSGEENPNHGGQTHDRADLNGGRNTHTPPRTRSRTSETDTRPNRPEANRTDDRVPEAPRARDTNHSGASGSGHRGGQPEYAKAERADRPDTSKSADKPNETKTNENGRNQIDIDFERSKIKGTPENDLVNNLKPNTDYSLSNGTKFSTNEHGYVDKISFKPDFDNPGKRDSRQTNVGKEGIDGDVGGHIQACVFGGTCDRYNLFPQNGNFNNSAYKTYFENVIRKAHNEGKEVGNITVDFYRSNPSSSRPDALTVTYTVDGKPRREYFLNEIGGGK